MGRDMGKPPPEQEPVEPYSERDVDVLIELAHLLDGLAEDLAAADRAGSLEGLRRALIPIRVGIEDCRSWFRPLQPLELRRSYQYWQDEETGQVYAIRISRADGRVTGCAGSVTYDDLQRCTLAGYFYEQTPALAAWAEARRQPFRPVRSEGAIEVTRGFPPPGG